MGKVRVGTVSQFAPGTATKVDVDGTSVLIVATDAGLCATSSRCPHLNLPLAKGPGGVRVEGSHLTCTWHMSTFDACTGENLDWAAGVAGRQAPRWSRQVLAMGRTPKPIPTYLVTVEGDDVFVEV
jgi:nitrite reductase/ring-hydroxylating ferredoxin subunit